MFGKGAVLMGMPIGIFSLSNSFSAWQFAGKFSGAAWWFLALLVILGLIVLLLPRLFVGVRKDEPRAARKAPPPSSAEALQAEMNVETPAKTVESQPEPVAPPLAERAADVEPVAAPAAPIVEPEPEPEPVAPPQPDDLTRVEGIGPKISALLQEAGIFTFAQLSTANVDHLRQILDKPRFRLADPETWPEQAQLAAVGDWDGLTALQNTFKGGRRVK